MKSGRDWKPELAATGFHVRVSNWSMPICQSEDADWYSRSAEHAVNCTDNIRQGGCHCADQIMSNSGGSCESTGRMEGIFCRTGCHAGERTGKKQQQPQPHFTLDNYRQAATLTRVQALAATLHDSGSSDERQATSKNPTAEDACESAGNDWFRQFHKAPRNLPASGETG